MMSGRKGDEWQDCEIDCLLELLRTCESFMGVTRELNAKFGTTRSRNSIIGKVKRLNVDHKFKRDFSAVRNIRIERANALHSNVISPRSLTKAELCRPLDIEGGFASLPDNGKCAWPIDNGACSETARIGAYCVGHAKLAYSRLPSVRRNQCFRGPREETSDDDFSILECLENEALMSDEGIEQEMITEEE
jgi:hypothetical protein